MEIFCSTLQTVCFVVKKILYDDMFCIGLSMHVIIKVMMFILFVPLSHSA